MHKSIYFSWNDLEKNSKFTRWLIRNLKKSYNCKIKGIKYDVMTCLSKKRLDHSVDVNLSHEMARNFLFGYANKSYHLSFL